MAKGIVLKGNDYNSMIRKGLEKLNKTKSEVDIKVYKLKDEKQKYKVKIILKEDSVNEHDLFELSFESDGVYMIFKKNVADEKKFLAYVKEYFKYLQLENINTSELSASNHAEGDKILVAPMQEEPKIDEKMAIRNASDGMSAYVEFYPAVNGESLSDSDVRNKIESKINFGVIESKLSELKNNRCYFKEIIIARGIEPQNGTDGFIDYKINLVEDTTPEILEDGTVDYKDLHTITTISKDETIGILHSAKSGINGKKIDGTPILATDGKKINMTFGKNIAISDDKRIYSTRDGFVQKKKNAMAVIELLEIKGDVDPSTGNIDFDGNALIQGIVKSGFSVHARDGIVVKGVAEGAVLESDGDIVLKKGMHGHEEGIVRTKGNVISNYLANCTVEAGGEIKSGAIMHSKIASQQGVYALGKGATIVGGIVRSKGDVHAGVIGSEVETATTIEVGVDPELKRRHEVVHNDLISEKNQFDNISKSILVLSKKAKSSDLGDKDKRKLAEFLKKKNELEDDIKKLEEEYEKIEQQFEQLNKGKIRVEDCIYPGVKIIIGNDVMFVRRKLNKCSVYRADGEIKVGPY